MFARLPFQTPPLSTAKRLFTKIFPPPTDPTLTVTPEAVIPVLASSIVPDETVLEDN
jgi:hypothetical protein